jgi:two-component system nitrate/nitrite response regulator NarL
VQGQRIKEIAAALDLSPRSVESIKYRMMQDLNVQSTAALVRYALQHNIVES